MRHHHVAKALALTLLCLLLVPGCEQGDEPVQVALILSGASGHYWENIVEGAQTAAERMDIPLRCYMPDEEKEIRLEDLPAQAARDGADALVVASQGQQELLAGCYRSCLELAAAHGLRSVAFCCISTGEFHFPAELAARTAIRTVQAWQQAHPDSIEVIFNVYQDSDLQIYQRLLQPRGTAAP